MEGRASETSLNLGERFRQLVREGNRRRVIVEKDSHRAVDLSLTLLVISALLAVWLVAILAAIAVMNGYTIRMEMPIAAAASDDEAGAAGPPAPTAGPPPAGQ